MITSFHQIFDNRHQKTHYLLDWMYTYGVFNVWNLFSLAVFLFFVSSNVIGSAADKSTAFCYVYGSEYQPLFLIMVIPLALLLAGANSLPQI